MNSEELEKSLKAEFESYLKGVLADMREGVKEFQTKIDAEFEKHRSQLDDAFRGFSSRFDDDHEFDSAFRESVIEHLRLARDEGAKITATAMAEAEDLEKASSPTVNLADLKDAINDISSKDSQSAILKSLIHHAAEFTPRVAFFIIKNEQFVGWKVFGKEAGEGESTVRDIHFPVSADTVLGAAVGSQAIAEGSFGTYSEDGLFLSPLHFGSPDRMYAIPLVARGRGVAVLYADYGHEGVTVNTDAIEMLVRVAGLTVEMLASAKAIRSGAEHTGADFAEAGHEADGQSPDAHPGDSYAAPSFDASPAVEYTMPEPEAATELEQPEPVSDFQFSPSVTDIGFDAGQFETIPETADETPVSDLSLSSELEMAPEYVIPVTSEPVVEELSGYGSAEFESTQSDTDLSPVSVPHDDSVLAQELGAFETVTEPAQDVHDFAIGEPSVTEPAIAFDQPTVEEPARFEASPFDQPAERFEPALMNGGGVATAPVVEKTTSAPTGTRLSDRNVDLPIEVADDERRLHNDARRFARLLVSEIKLYNEKKVQEGRESNDLYDRLREAIDRSREMYDKRVQPPVAAKFDYFHYELVNALAEGDEARLGSSYQGAKV